MEITTNDDNRLYSISEVSRLTGVPAHTIRFWEKDFGDYLNPDRTQGGQRRYRESDIEVVRTIKHYRYVEKHTIAGVIEELTNGKNAEKGLNVEKMIDEIVQILRDKLMGQDRKLSAK
jgi:DNA-binding transcriptional MerR regulator